MKNLRLRFFVVGQKQEGQRVDSLTALDSFNNVKTSDCRLAS